MPAYREVTILYIMYGHSVFTISDCLCHSLEDIICLKQRNITQGNDRQSKIENHCMFWVSCFYLKPNIPNFL